MGRKSIGSEGEESKVISFRVSADTHDKLLKKIEATGLTKSEFIRDYVLQEKTTVQAADQDAQQQHKKILFTVATASNMPEHSTPCASPTALTSMPFASP